MPEPYKAFRFTVYREISVVLWPGSKREAQVVIEWSGTMSGAITGLARETPLLHAHEVHPPRE